ncbi:MAG: sugar phosphate isomerase/epimerase [Methylacidiphilales bacterium]|nr:sugar phosphate isomerase/epimerase [Candidatus Methylacidiphilales bacterium]
MTSFKIDQVALQLYTLRDFCKTPTDLAATAQKVRKIGYQSVQISGVGVQPPEAKKILNEAGLTICATHESSDFIRQDPEAVCERLHQAGVKHTAFPYPSGVDFGDETSVRNLARQLEHAGAVLAKRGFTLSYHNHAIEFVRFGPLTVLDYIYQATSPDHLKAELDTYWIQYGGGDPVAWIEKMSGRMSLLHLKDFAFLKDGKAAFAEIGQGNLNWRRILAAAEKSGAEWLIIEQDTCAGDPFDSIRISFDYIQKLLAE